MLFNSLEFVIFLPIVLLVFLFLSGKPLRIFLLIASYIFYGWANPFYILLLMLSTVLDFNIGRWMSRTDDAERRKMLLLASVVGNLGILTIFKYSGFIVQSVNDVAGLAGLELGLIPPNIILPVGISFYTFQTLSYTIDIYRGKMEATDQLSAFALFVAFFPQLVAGPIERARDLLPQLMQKQSRTTDDILVGFTRILWGLTKKVVFADNIAIYVNQIYSLDALDTVTAPEIILGTWLFAFQIYFDFSAYSDIAIGIARMMGIRLNENFRHPYLSRTVAEFWRRWHISLSTWLRDYLYIPLGGSRYGLYRTILNVIIVFFLGGLWHGADAKFIVWGLWIGIAIGIYNLLAARFKYKNDYDRPFLWRDLFGIFITFQIIAVSWVFFRADSFDVAVTMLQQLFVAERWIPAEVLNADELEAAVLIFAFVVMMHFVRGVQLDRAFLQVRRPELIGVFWAILIAIIAIFHADLTEQFIYFQF